MSHLWSQLLANTFIAASMHALVGVGFSLIYSTARFFHFAHGAVYTASAYLAYSFIMLTRCHILVGAIVGVAFGMVLGGLMESIVYRRIRNTGGTPLVLLLSSLGMTVALQNVISLIYLDSPRMLRRTLVEQGVNVFGARVTPIQLGMIGASVVACLALSLFLRKSRIGLLIRAVADDRDLARAMGVDVDRVILMTVILGSGLAGAAGILVGLDTDLVPSMGFNALLLGVVAAIVGGIGSISGVLAGSLLVGLAQHLGVLQLPTEWQQVVIFVVLIVFLLFRPQGFFGSPFRQSTI